MEQFFNSPEFENLESSKKRELLAICDQVATPDLCSEEAIRAAYLGEGTWARALGMSANDIEASIKAAEELLKQGKVGEAKELLEFTVAICPIDARPLIYLGQLALEEDNFEEAERLFTAAVGVYGDDLGARAGRAIALLRRGATPSAIPDIKAALALDPSGDLPLTVWMASVWEAVTSTN